MRKLVGLVSVILLALAAPAWATNPTVFSITPHTHLVDGTTITIAWSGAPYGEGFREAYILTYQPCTLAWKTSHSTSDCADGGGTLMGGPSGQVNWTVHAGAVGTNGGTCGTSSTDSQCLLVVQEQDRHRDPVMAPKALRIRFAVP